MAAPEQNLRTQDLDYELPPELVAQTPLARRDDSRLLVVERAGWRLAHRHVSDLPSLLRSGDLLVANNSRVLPARLRAVKTSTGGSVELLLLRRVADGAWNALARPSRRLRPGTELRVLARDGSGSEALATVEAIGPVGEVTVRLSDGMEAALERYGEVPLPPYIHEDLADSERYQTVFSSVTGSAAAPTAGLHITPELVDALRQAGVGWAEVTLHIGLDTFRPISAELVGDHVIHEEWCAVDDETARRIAATRRQGGRVIAVGTTAARTLETLGRHFDDGDPRGFSGMTGIFILPGHRWTLVDGLLTNFHLPRSTLLAMVSALVRWERLKAAYATAISERYRFYSFGDAMLIV